MLQPPPRFPLAMSPDSKPPASSSPATFRPGGPPPLLERRQRLERWETSLVTLVASEPALAKPWAHYLEAELREADAAQLASKRDASEGVHAAALLARLGAYEAALAFLRAVAEHDAALARRMGKMAHASERAGEREHVESLLLRSTALDAVGVLPTAATLLAEAGARVAKLDDPALQLTYLVARGRLLVMLGDEATASTILHAGAALATKLGARRQEAKLVGNLGFLHGEHDGRSYEAYTRRALAIGEELGDERLVVHSLCNLGGALAQQGRYDEARECYQAGLPRAKALGWEHSVALFLAGLGGVEAGTGKLDQGVSLYSLSSEYFLSVNDTFQVARQRVLIARHLVAAGRLGQAQAELERGLSYCGGERFRTTAMQAHDLLSIVFERRGDLARALASSRAAGEIREALAEARIHERMRVLELHAEAERATREVELERERRTATESALAEQQRLREQYESLARTDPLTGLSNRRHLTEVLGHELSYVKRRYRPLTVLLVDVDHFKKVNDTHGHDAGDAVLVEVAKRLVEGVRDQDWVCRWGGEEFCIALVDTTESQGSIVAGRLLASIRERPIATPRGTIRVSASVGLTALRGQAEPLDTLLQRADEALYAAKRAGRDRFLAAP